MLQLVQVGDFEEDRGIQPVVLRALEFLRGVGAVNQAVQEVNDDALTPVIAERYSVRAVQNIRVRGSPEFKSGVDGLAVDAA